MLFIRPKKYYAVELNNSGLTLKQYKIPSFFTSNTLVIKPLLIGICRSDIKEVTGERTVRHDFGHEIIGKVLWTNNENNFKKDNIVVLNPHIKINREAGFSEILIASANANNLKRAFIKINPFSNYKKMIFIEPMSCAYHCVSRIFCYLRLRSLKKQSVAIIGAGLAGTLIGLIAKKFGATVTIFNRSDDKLVFLKKQNIFNNDELKNYNYKLKRKYDIVIPATTFLLPEIMEYVIKKVKNNGLLLLFGGTNKRDALVDSKINIDIIRRNQKNIYINYKNKRFRIAGTYGANTKDFISVIRLLEQNDKYFPVDKLINKEIRLKDLIQTMCFMKDHRYYGKTIVNLTI